MDKVLCCNELVEGILEQLPPKEVLITARLVCKKWKTLVDDSPALKRHTFMAPEQCGPIWFKYAPNPEGYAGTMDECRLVNKPSVLIPDNSIELNDLVHRNKIKFLKGYGFAHGIHRSHKSVSWLLYFPKLDQQTPFFNNPSATWRKMQLSKPPIRRCYVRTQDCHDSSKCYPEYVNVLVEDENGITFGQIYDTLMPIKCSADDQKFSCWFNPFRKDEPAAALYVEHACGGICRHETHPLED